MEIPKWKDCSLTSMSKHFRDFGTYLSLLYGVEGFPLDWVVRPQVRPVYWSNLTTLSAHQHGKRPNFYAFEETDHRCQTIVPIVPWDDAHHLKCNDPKVHESGSLGTGHIAKAMSSTMMMQLSSNWLVLPLLTLQSKFTSSPRRARCNRGAAVIFCLQGSIHGY